MAKKKTKAAPPTKITSSEYDKLTGSGYRFSSRESQEQQGKLVKAVGAINRLYGPQFGNPNKGMAVPKPERPVNQNRVVGETPLKKKPKPKNSDPLKNMAKAKKK